MLDIADVDRHLIEHSHFCVIDWVMFKGFLSYTDYEAWRYGRIETLDDSIILDKSQRLLLFSKVEKHCSALGLSREPQEFYSWFPQRQAPLVISDDRDQQIHFSQRWIKNTDNIPQLDLFIDGAAVHAENQLCEALSARQWAMAEQSLNRLMTLNSGHTRLGSYQALVSYGRHIADIPKVPVEELSFELDGLEQEVEPLAQEVLGRQARDFLACAWRRLATSLVGHAYTSQAVKLHSSYALAQIPDWHAVQQNLLTDQALYHHPELIGRLAASYRATNKPSEALILWCLRLEKYPHRLEAMVEECQDHRLARLWEDFEEQLEAEPECHFPVYVLLRHPELVHVMDQFPALCSPAWAAAKTLLLNRRNNEDEIGARNGLQTVSPALLKLYLSRLRR